VTYDPQPPGGRFGHSAVSVDASCLLWIQQDTGADPNKPWQSMGMIVYGGSFQSTPNTPNMPAPSARITSEVWLLKYWGFEDGYWVWDQIDQEPDQLWPPGRVMHTATMHNTTMVVWGGRMEAPTVVDDSLWALELGGTEPPYWHQVTLAVAPTLRCGHTMTYYNESAMFMFGGVTLEPGSGSVGTYLNEAWVLRLPGPSTCTRSLSALKAAREKSCVALTPKAGAGPGMCTLFYGCVYNQLSNTCADLCVQQSNAKDCGELTPGCEYRPAGTYSWQQLTSTGPLGSAWRTAILQIDVTHEALTKEIVFYGGVAQGRYPWGPAGGGSELVQGAYSDQPWSPPWSPTPPPTGNGTPGGNHTPSSNLSNTTTLNSTWQFNGYSPDMIADWNRVNITLYPDVFGEAGGKQPGPSVYHTAQAVNGAMVLFGGLNCDLCGPSTQLLQHAWCLDVVLPPVSNVVASWDSPGPGPTPHYQSMSIHWSLTPDLELLLNRITVFIVYACQKNLVGQAAAASSHAVPWKLQHRRSTSAKYLPIDQDCYALRSVTNATREVSWDGGNGGFDNTKSYTFKIAAVATCGVGMYSDDSNSLQVPSNNVPGSIATQFWAWFAGILLGGVVLGGIIGWCATSQPWAWGEESVLRGERLLKQDESMIRSPSVLRSRRESSYSFAEENAIPELEPRPSLAEIEEEEQSLPPLLRQGSSLAINPAQVEIGERFAAGGSGQLLHGRFAGTEVCLKELPPHVHIW